MVREVRKCGGCGGEAPLIQRVLSIRAGMTFHFRCASCTRTFAIYGVWRSIVFAAIAGALVWIPFQGSRLSDRDRTIVTILCLGLSLVFGSLLARSLWNRFRNPLPPMKRRPRFARLGE